MKFILFVLISLCYSVQSFSQTQLEMNESARTEFLRADKELNSIYQKMLKDNAADTIFINNLKTAQRAWIQFRDAEMKMKYPEREDGFYGSAAPMCWNIYLKDLTTARIRTLKQWVDGIEEGDVCGGSIPVKN